jgi:hypothetical protein
MSIATGEIKYTIGNHYVRGCGVLWNSDELSTALAGPVAKVVFDDSGKADVSALLSGVAETEFEEEEIKKILEDKKTPENWRVGEALAESYLTDKKKCYFPWPDGRDERKTGSSLPGADLVGFQNDNGNEYFAFGEVKTSNEETYPPGAMYGRTGLKKQLEDLKDNKKVRDDLVMYLGYRASNAEWKEKYQLAAKNYIQSSTSVRNFGVLVRDVDPHEDDLHARVSRLAENPYEDMKIDLLAVYLPKGSISTLSSDILGYRSGGEA